MHLRTLRRPWSHWRIQDNLSISRTVDDRATLMPRTLTESQVPRIWTQTSLGAVLPLTRHGTPRQRRRKAWTSNSPPDCQMPMQGDHLLDNMRGTPGLEPKERRTRLPAGQTGGKGALTPGPALGLLLHPEPWFPVLALRGPIICQPEKQTGAKVQSSLPEPP